MTSLSELVSLDIAILGAGREGLAAWRWLRHHFPDKAITIYDERPSLTMRGVNFDEARDRLVKGPFEAEQLSMHDLLIRSPGISPYRSDLRALREAGVQFTSASSLWFAQHPGEKTICITGTKGKSTTAALVAHLLSASGLKTQLAGNIGFPLLDYSGEVLAPSVDWWVIELSSYQLVDLVARPSIAVILNLTDEHLDWHGGSMSYQDDKMRMGELANGAPLIANRSDEVLSRRLADDPNICWFEDPAGFHTCDDRIWNGTQELKDIPRQSLPGPHNLSNLAAALTIIQRAGIEMDCPADHLGSFTGLPHRLQTIGSRGGVRFVDDSLSTTPVATLAALEAFRSERIIILLGGMDRGLDWRRFTPQMKECSPHAVICMPDNGEDIARVLSESGVAPEGGVFCTNGLPEAMQVASRLANERDVILLSPGAPSFPRFRDYEDRGQQFAELAGFKKREIAGEGEEC